jgi:hypothetical protein
MNKERQYLDIDNAIIIHDVKQIKKEPAEKKIKTKRQLAKKLAKKKLYEGSEVSIYTKLSRYEKDGFSTEDLELTSALLKVLEVTKEELIKTMQ